LALTPEFDLAVVGGGIVGLATAWSFQQRSPDARVVVLEAGSELACQQTGNNSGVIHTGVYYAPGSIKARLCVEGAALMRDFCRERSIQMHRCGKLIVARDPAELPRLDELERRGHANGVPGLQRLDAAELAEREPDVHGVAALWSPEAAVVDFRQVALALAAEIRAAGGLIETEWPVTSVTGAEVRSNDGRAIGAARMIACAGHGASRLAHASGADVAVRIAAFRGTYLHLRPERANLVSAMIYPVPDPALPFLGVHFTPTIDGGLALGPTALLLPRLPTMLWPGTLRMVWRHRRAAVSEIRMAASRRALLAAARRYVPALGPADLLPESSHGVRAQALSRDGTLIDDFAFAQDGPVLHVLNAPSPAATSALAIGAMLAAR